MNESNATLTPQEHIALAKQLCHRLEKSSSLAGPVGESTKVQGVDPNELKKLYTFLIRHRNLNQLMKLIDKLPESNFARRSGKTPGYHKNIKSSIDAAFYRLPVDDAIQILGWTCRLLRRPKEGRR
ncbi:MAG: hypothetical protein DMF61_23390 [Blastocatellia bacterium AA13]|nr:MAG: hypothetical protein DMF61_23390 [Blastocatellia bacterium AA13]